MKKVILFMLVVLMLISNIADATTYQEEKDNTPQDVQKYLDDFNNGAISRKGTRKEDFIKYSGEVNNHCFLYKKNL